MVFRLTLIDLVLTRHKKGASDLCRTATTTYPCCIPALGDSVGAGRTGLTPAAKVVLFFSIATQ